jgi:hypothetical protein
VRLEGRISRGSEGRDSEREQMNGSIGRDGEIERRLLLDLRMDGEGLRLHSVEFQSL